MSLKGVQKVLKKAFGIKFIIFLISIFVTIKILRVFVFDTLTIASASMAPALLPGDSALINRLVKFDEIKPGDMIAYSWASKIYVSRVVGTSPSKISINNSGNLVIDDTLIESRPAAEPFVNWSELSEKSGSPYSSETHEVLETSLTNGQKLHVLYESSRGVWKDAAASIQLNNGELLVFGDNRTFGLLSAMNNVVKKSEYLVKIFCTDRKIDQSQILFIMKCLL